MIGLVLVVAAFFQARNSIAIAVTLLTTIGVGWVLFAGTPYRESGAGNGLVWWMLIGGALDSTVRLSRGQGSDAYWLARRTSGPAHRVARGMGRHRASCASGRAVVRCSRCEP